MSWEGRDPSVSRDLVGRACCTGLEVGEEGDSAWKWGCSGTPGIANCSWKQGRSQEDVRGRVQFPGLIAED